jgi:hypothetical protein
MSDSPERAADVGNEISSLPCLDASPKTIRRRSCHRTTIRYNAASKTMQIARKYKFFNALDLKSFIYNRLPDPLRKLTNIESIHWVKD